jgi:signal transduction histidine kinase
LLQRLAELNDELSLELSVIEQSIWIAKRNWSFIVHGTVQGALTVAHTRLKQAGKDSKEVLKLVQGDIEKARQALEQGVVNRQSAAAEFQDLITTWEGVCEVSIDYPEQAFEQIDETSRICSIEIVKEIVGNAFRHGQATKVEFKIEIAKDRVQIQARNNGTPVTESTIGLGTDLLNELTESWSIANESGGVVVRARIPFRSV